MAYNLERSDELELNKIYNEDCLEGMKRIPDKSIDLIVTSPPYAEQRKKQYGGVPENDYPRWTVKWLNEAKRILTDEGSVFINIRPHISNGEISDYVLRTRLAIRESGWAECEELIWIKPDSPPLGSTKRPRRAWESILWFSKTGRPYCDTKANGRKSDRIGFENNKKSNSDLYSGKKKAVSGVARSKDYIEVGTGKVGKGIEHPAIYPVEVPEYLIKMCTKEKGNVLDPFMGSGTTAIASMRTGRNYIGFELDKGYFDIANDRIDKHKRDMAKDN